MNLRDFLKAAAIAGAGLSLSHTFNALIGLAEAADF
ncbi:MAG: twin-arginine translocation signal domain-containing protein [Nitrospirota bacterium]